MINSVLKFFSTLSDSLLVLLIWRQLRIQRYAHNLQSMFALKERWNSDEMTIARRAACTQYAGNGSWNRSKEFVAEFFEDLGWCVLQGALPMPLVWSAFSYEVEHYWPMLEKEIKDIRTKRNDKTLFTDFELLRSRCKRFTRKKNRWSSSAIPIHIDDFVKSETQKLGHYSRLRDKKRIIVPHSNRNGKQGKSSRRAKGARG